MKTFATTIASGARDKKIFPVICPVAEESPMMRAITAKKAKNNRENFAAKIIK
jgi:hypothetical protein